MAATEKFIWMMPAESSCQGKPVLYVIDLECCMIIMFDSRIFCRMRSHIKRGSIKNRFDYEILRNDVWNEVYSLDKEGVILYDSDLQQIAMIKANERNLHDFKVCIRSDLFP